MIVYNLLNIQKQIFIFYDFTVKYVKWEIVKLKIFKLVFKSHLGVQKNLFNNLMKQKSIIILNA